MFQPFYLQGCNPVYHWIGGHLAAVPPCLQWPANAQTGDEPKKPGGFWPGIRETYELKIETKNCDLEKVSSFQIWQFWKNFNT